MNKSETKKSDSAKESTEESLRLIDDLKFFLATAPANWQENQIIRRYFLNKEEGFVSCVYWNNLYFISGTDIVRCIAYKLFHLGRKVIDRKKFEEGIFSDLRALKCGTHAVLEKPRSDFVKFLHKHQCLRTQKKQKVFFWFSVPHDQLFFDALERDLKKEAANEKGTTEAYAEPSLSFKYHDDEKVNDQLKSHLDSMGLKMVESFESELEDANNGSNATENGGNAAPEEDEEEEDAAAASNDFVDDFPLDYLQQVESSVINPDYLSFNSVVGAYNPMLNAPILVTPSVGELTLAAATPADGSMDNYNMSNENYLAYGTHYMEPPLYMQSPATPYFSGPNDMYLLDQATPIAPTMFHQQQQQFLQQQQQQIQQQQIQQQYYALYLQAMQSGATSEQHPSLVPSMGIIKAPSGGTLKGMTPTTALFYTPTLSNSYLISPVNTRVGENGSKKRKASPPDEEEGTNKENGDAEEPSKKKNVNSKHHTEADKEVVVKKQKNNGDFEKATAKAEEETDPSPQILSSAPGYMNGGTFNYMPVPSALQTAYQNSGMMGFTPYYSTIPQPMGPTNGLSPYITFSPTLLSHPEGPSLLIGGGHSTAKKDLSAVHSAVHHNKENSKHGKTPSSLSQSKKTPISSTVSGGSKGKSSPNKTLGKKPKLMNPALRHLNVDTLFDGEDAPSEESAPSNEKSDAQTSKA